MKHYIWVSIVVAMLFLTEFFQSVQDAVVLFVIAGIIPGTSFSIPPLIMLALAITAMVFVLRIGRRETRKIILPPLEPAGQEAIKKRAKNAGFYN